MIRLPLWNIVFISNTDVYFLLNNNRNYQYFNEKSHIGRKVKEHTFEE